MLPAEPGTLRGVYQAHISQLLVTNSAPDNHANKVLGVLQDALRLNGQCDRTILPVGGQYSSDPLSRVNHGLLEHTCTALRRLDCVLSLQGGQCLGKGPLLYECEDLSQLPESEKGRVKIIPPRSRGGAWLELRQAGGRVFPCIPVSKRAAAYLRNRHIHHLDGLVVQRYCDGRARWFLRSPQWQEAQEADELYTHPGQTELHESLIDGIAYPNGELCQEVEKYMKWQDMYTKNAWRYSDVDMTMTLGEPYLAKPTQPESCELHHSGCPEHEACLHPMTLVFPIEERSSAKMTSFRDMLMNKVGVAPRRFEWLRDIHGHRMN
eukprot:gene14872-biopygen1526